MTTLTIRPNLTAKEQRLLDYITELHPGEPNPYKGKKDKP
jgi:hypothetical protein